MAAAGIAPAAAEGLLWNTMQDPDWRVRFDAAGALGAYTDETTRRALQGWCEKNLDQEHPYVRSRLERILRG